MNKLGLIGVILFIVLVGLVLVYVAAKTKNNPENVDKPNTQSQTTNSMETQNQATQAVKKGQDVPELKIEDLKPGTGEAVKSGDTSTGHYTGTLLDGTKFDSSVDRGQPFSFTIGVGQVIKGWDQGLIGMKVGGERKLTLPSSLAYGDRGAGAVIPPGSALVFDVQLLEIKSP